MPSSSEHGHFAIRLAKLLGADPHYARLGAMFPDLDVMPPMKHRRTLHGFETLLVLLGGGTVIRDPRWRGFVVGYLSHLSLDFLTVPSRLFAKILRGVRNA